MASPTRWCEFEWTPGVGDGQGGLVCCSSWGHKKWDTTERLNWTELNHLALKKYIMILLSYIYKLLFIQLSYINIFNLSLNNSTRWFLMKIKIDAFKLWCWRRLLRVPWTARRCKQSILKEISPGFSLEGMMLKLGWSCTDHVADHAMIRWLIIH